MPTPSPTILDDLERRLVEAKGPDREIDARLWHAFFPSQRALLHAGSVRPPTEVIWGTVADIELEGWPKDEWAGLADHIGATRLSASVDDALAFVGRVRPGHRVTMAVTLGDVADGFAGISKKPFEIGRPVFYAELAQAAANAPLALCLALVRALRKEVADHDR